MQPDPSLLAPSTLEGSEPLLTLADEMIDSYLCDDEITEPVLCLHDKEVFKNKQSERFTSLREELSKAEGKPMRIEFDPTDILGYAFVKKNSEGNDERCQVVDCDNASQQVTLELLHGDKETMEYNDLINLINKHNEDGDQLWSFKGIKGHRKKNKKWEVLVDWDHVNASWEPLEEIRLADSITLADYAIKNKLIYQVGWKWAKKKNKSSKKFSRMAKIYKSQVKDLKARFKFGIEVPRGVKEALRLDEKNGDTKWMDAINKEKDQLFDFKTFEVLNKNEKAPKGYKRIPGFYVFDVKHDLRRKARYVAGGHMSIAPKEDSYSGVVDHENVRITLFLAEHNGLELMAADIGNAYLHAKTREKVFIIAGPEFGPDLEGRVMLVVKSLYGLTTSAARWHEELSKTLRSMGFTPTKADHDLWLKDCGTHYEYLCTWVDGSV